MCSPAAFISCGVFKACWRGGIGSDFFFFLHKQKTTFIWLSCTVVINSFVIKFPFFFFFSSLQSASFNLGLGPRAVRSRASPACCCGGRTGGVPWSSHWIFLHAPWLGLVFHRENFFSLEPGPEQPDVIWPCLGHGWGWMLSSGRRYLRHLCPGSCFYLNNKGSYASGMLPDEF